MSNSNIPTTRSVGEPANPRAGTTTVTFEQLVAGLEAKPAASGWYNAKCPVPGHGKGRGDRSSSFGFIPGDFTIVLKCHAGCDPVDIALALEQRGLWPVQVESLGQRVPATKTKRDILPILVRINEGLKPLANTRADRYLSGRAINVRSPHELAYHPSLFHGWSRTSWPAMVAVVRDVQGRTVDFQQLWLSIAQPITKAKLRGQELKPPRAWVGSPYGHAVHLAPAAPTMLLGEGIETVLSAMQIYNLPGWAALTANNLVQVQLPPIVREVIIAADDDDPGFDGAVAAVRRFRRQGLQARIIMPPKGFNDFNDYLQAGVHSDA